MGNFIVAYRKKGAYICILNKCNNATQPHKLPNNMDKQLIERLTECRYPLSPFSFKGYSDLELAHFTTDMLMADRSICDVKYVDDTVILIQEAVTEDNEDCREDLLAGKITDALTNALATWADTDVTYFSIMQYTNRGNLNHLLITIHFVLSN